MGIVGENKGKWFEESRNQPPAPPAPQEAVGRASVQDGNFAGKLGLVTVGILIQAEEEP